MIRTVSPLKQIEHFNCLKLCKLNYLLQVNDKYHSREVASLTIEDVEGFWKLEGELRDSTKIGNINVFLSKVIAKSFEKCTNQICSTNICYQNMKNFSI